MNLEANRHCVSCCTAPVAPKLPTKEEWEEQMKRQRRDALLNAIEFAARHGRNISPGWIAELRTLI